MQTLVDKFFSRAKDHKLLAAVTIIGMVIVALGAVTGALNDIIEFSKNINGDSRKLVPQQSTKGGQSLAKTEFPDGMISESEEDVQALIGSVKSIKDDYYAAVHIRSNIGKIKGGVTGAQLARIIGAADIEDDYYCAVAISGSAKFIRKPILANEIELILSTISDDYYKLVAAQAFMHQ